MSDPNAPLVPLSPTGRIIYIGACLIAGLRLQDESEINQNPRAISRIYDSIRLAKEVYDRCKRDFPQFFEKNSLS